MRRTLILAIALGCSMAGSAQAAAVPDLPASPDAREFVLKEAGGQLVCSESSAIRLARPVRAVEVHPINHLDSGRSPQAERTSLTVQLRGTAQLEAFPLAKAAFIRAAAVWENLVASPITVIVDVDFGVNRFGVPFPANVLGSTGSDSRLNATGYPSLRSALISSFPASPVYQALPTVSVPTDLGPVASITTPSSTFRVVGLLPAAADPNGTVPSIGFNSAFPYDFDPSDGIDAGRRDFEAVAAHEIGHVLGFVSSVGGTELDSPRSPSLSTWDLFRFRPGAAQGGFTTSGRVLSSGGSQVFSRGSTETALSTGRPDGTGGDGQQASHWKDDAQSGQYVGIMDPTLSKAVHPVITAQDLLVLDALGYTVAPRPAAQVTGISPGSVAQYRIDADVAIQGVGFASGATATLDGRLIPSRVVSSTQMQATLPASSLLTSASSKAVGVLNPAAAPSGTTPVNVTAAAGCPGDASTLCLNNGRFLVRADWTDATGNTGHATAVSLTGDTGYFWFFSASNIEVVVKALNGCAFNSNYWVFAGGLTNVDVLLTVADTQQGAVKTYRNTINTAFAPIQDTTAFATCP
ncbi:MAG: NF038122 family metalloprotease [Acidobacteriota bacterium]|nr:NF038122 family metalloprotease [Acidobacteriota bacterium]